MSENTTEAVQDNVQEVATDSQNQEPTSPEVGSLIAESKKYRKRAQDAEARLLEYQKKFEQAEEDKLKKKEFFSPDWISGSFVLLQKKDFDEIGGWDEDFFMYYEDMDICKRARILNIKPKFYNSIFCYHMHGKSSRFDYDIKVNSKAQVIKSSHIYIKKHYKGLSRNIISLILYISQATELLILSIFVLIPHLHQLLIL